MLRGINRSIIEINETENKYFEKILIFVKPEFGALPDDRLRKEATKLVGSISAEPMGLRRTASARRRMEIRKRKRALFISALLGITILTVVIFKIF